MIEASERGFILSRKKKERLPTHWQQQTLKWLMEGGQLIIGKWPDMSHHPDPGVMKYSNKERIYWKIKVPELVSLLNPEGYDTIDCGYPKMKRYWMSHMERYGWVIYTGTTWEITEDGRKSRKNDTKTGSKKPVSPWALLLRAFDPVYFKDDEDGGRCPETLEDAGYDLATWFYDNEKAGKLKKMLTKMPEELWTLALKNWRDRKHDT